MSINYPQDTSVQLSYTSFPFTTSPLDNYCSSNYVSNISNLLINNINTKQNILTAATSLLGDGANITNLTYGNISGKPSYFPADFNTLINKPTYYLTDWNTTITGKPTYFPPDPTTYYTKTQTDTLLNAKQATLTFTSPLVNTTNTITFNESAITSLTNFYNKSSTDILLNAKQASISTYTITGATGGSLGFSLGTLTLAMPTNYTANISISNLITPTAFTYKGTELTTTLNTKQNTLTFTSPLVNTTNTITLNESAITTLTNFYNKSSTDALLNAKQETLTFTSPLVNTANTITINLSTYSTTGNDPNYLKLTGGTLTGNLIINAASANPTIRFGSVTGHNWGIASTIGGLSTSSQIGDMILRSANRLLLQSGTATAAMVIDTANNVGIGTTTNASYKLTVDGALNSTSFYNNGTLINFSSYATNTDLTTNYYNKSTTDTLLNAKQATLTFTSPLVNTTNTITLNESAISSLTNFYNKTTSDGRYLQLSGGNMIGQLNISTSTIDNQITLATTATTNFCSIKFKNDGANYGYIGIAASALTGGGYYVNNLFLEATNSIIFNSGGQTSASANSPRMILNSSGNLGIGTTNPTTKLHIEHSSTSTGSYSGGLYVYNPTNSANNCSIIGTRIGGNLANKALYSLDVNGYYGWSMYINGNDTTDKTLRFNASWDAGGTDRLTIKADGTTNINGTLSVPNITLGSGGKINSYDDYHYIQINQPTDTLTIQEYGTISFNIGASKTQIASVNSSGLNTTILNISNGGSIALNKTTTSSWYIQQDTSPSSVADCLVFYHRETSPGTKASKWWFNGFQSSTSYEISDVRIKKEINDIQFPLNKIMELKPKEYYLCDDKDYNKKFGIISQDVEKVFPEFIHTDKDYIANIFKNAIYDNFIITLEQDITDLINIDDELKIILDNNDKDNLEIVIDDTPYNNRYKKRFVKVIEIIDNYSFKIDKELQENNIFVYGKKVNDFKRLDYESLYCLNIAATQELYKIIQQLQERISILETR